MVTALCIHTWVIKNKLQGTFLVFISLLRVGSSVAEGIVQAQKLERERGEGEGEREGEGEEGREKTDRLWIWHEHFKPQSPPPSDVLPPTRPHLLIPHKLHHSVVTKYLDLWTYGGHFH